MLDWQTLNDIEQLEQIQKDSFSTPQAIFKHSTTCPISAMAKNRLESSWNHNDLNVYYLDLLVFRPISNAIAEKWNVVHQSPQIIVIKDGKAIYDESHLDIHSDRIPTANV